MDLIDMKTVIIRIYFLMDNQYVRPLYGLLLLAAIVYLSVWLTEPDTVRGMKKRYCRNCDKDVTKKIDKPIGEFECRE